MHRRLRRWRVGATRQLAQRIGRMTKPKLGDLAQTIRQVVEHALGAEPLDRLELAARGPSRPHEVGVVGVREPVRAASESRRRRSAPRGRARSRRLPSRPAATRSHPSSWRTRRHASRARRPPARRRSCWASWVSQRRSLRRAGAELDVRRARDGDRPSAEERSAQVRGATAARERRLCAVAPRAERGDDPRHRRRSARGARPRHRRRAAGSASRARTHGADTCGSRSESRGRAEARTRAAPRRHSRGRDGAPRLLRPAGAGCPRSERGPRAPRGDRSRAPARCSRAPRGRPRR